MSEPEDFTPDKTTTTMVLQIVDIVPYGLLLAYGIYISVKYLVMQGKSKIAFLTVFYVLVVILTICRIGYMIVLLTYEDRSISKVMLQVTDDFNITSALIIGLLQIATMTDLAVQVKFSAEQMQRTEATRKIRCVKVTFFWVSVLIFAIALF